MQLTDELSSVTVLHHSLCESDPDTDDTIVEVGGGLCRLFVTETLQPAFSRELHYCGWNNRSCRFFIGYMVELDEWPKGSFYNLKAGIPHVFN